MELIIDKKHNREATRENLIEMAESAFNTKVLDCGFHFVRSSKETRVVGFFVFEPTEENLELDGIRCQAKLWETQRKMFGKNSIHLGPFMLLHNPDHPDLPAIRDRFKKK